MIQTKLALRSLTYTSVQIMAIKLINYKKILLNKNYALEK